MFSTALLSANPHITVFGFPIYAYAIIIVCGMIAAFFVISLLFKRRNMSSDLFLTMFCIALPIAIITTRLFYCITAGLPIGEWFAFSSIRSGGLSIIGGILGGTLSLIVICLVKKVNFFRVGDCVVVGLLLAQAIGRWGNFANQEVYGAEVTNEALQWFPFAVFIEANNAWHYAFFFYESLATATAAVLLFLHAWRNPKKPNGVNTALYFIVYGGVRSIMEPLRDPAYILDGGGIPWSLVFSLLLFAGGLALLITLLVLNKKKEGAYRGSVRGEPYGIADYIGDSKGETAYYDKTNMMCLIYPDRFTKKTEEEIEAEKGLFVKLFEKLKKKTDSETNDNTNENTSETVKEEVENAEKKQEEEIEK